MPSCSHDVTLSWVAVQRRVRWYRSAVDAKDDAANGKRRVALTLEFDGHQFRGWQWQPTGERTVQGVLQAAFANLPGEHGNVHGAGRTDAGVHALAMVAHVDTSTRLAPERLRLALNAHLPNDVAVLEVRDVPATFEAQFSATYRRYLYRMRLVRAAPRGLALDRNRVLMIHKALDVDAMQRATQAFLGFHDFSSLATQETRSKERTVLLCDLRVQDRDLDLHVAADGFLRGMVRTLAGTLLRVGQGSMRVEDVQEVLEARDRRRAGRSLPAHALYFAEAGYTPWDADASEAYVARRLGRAG